MHRTTLNIYYIALPCLMIGNITAMDNFDGAYALLSPKPKSSNFIKERNARIEAEFVEATANFRADVDNMTNHFKNFSALDPDKQQEVLKEWKILAECCFSEVELFKSGYNVGFEVSDETTQKLAAILVLYRNHKKHKKTGKGCLLQ